jgi:hypothetical protein
VPPNFMTCNCFFIGIKLGRVGFERVGKALGVRWPRLKNYTPAKPVRPPRVTWVVSKQFNQRGPWRRAGRNSISYGWATSA